MWEVYQIKNLFYNRPKAYNATIDSENMLVEIDQNEIKFTGGII